MEPTPEADVVDDTEESRIRDLTFKVEHIPEPELTADIDAIESGSQKTATKSSLIISNFLDFPRKACPENVGITAIEIYPRKSMDMALEDNERNGFCGGLNSDVTFGQPIEFKFSPFFVLNSSYFT